MLLYNAARKVNTQIKKYKKIQAGKYLSCSRRIEFVYPPQDGKYVAMTFDDGPTAYPTTSKPDVGLTDELLRILNKYNAKGTFDVIGSTAENYPDEEGTLGNFTWSGVHFDHYPKFNDDLSAGAVNQPKLIEKILSGGHEITSHTYSHRLYGPMLAIYGQRTHFDSLAQVINDLKMLDTYMKDNFNYEIKLSRPPHYIDNIPDKSTSYDAYRIMGYNYMAASFDGAGWQPEESYEKEVSAMIEPLQQALDHNVDCLNGKIIFQKDGCNMNLRTPVADALDKQLELLTQNGYKIVTVSELLALSAFEDFSPNSPQYTFAKKLLSKNHVIGYKNNTFQPERKITADEFLVMCAAPDIFKKEKAFSQEDMLLAAREYASKNKLFLNNGKIGNAMLELAMSFGTDIDEKKLKDNNSVKRADALELICKISEKLDV